MASCAIEVAVGLNDPWYNYRVFSFSSKRLNVYNAYRRCFSWQSWQQRAALLDQVSAKRRLLLEIALCSMAAHRDKFNNQVVAGSRFGDSYSPFCRNISSNFFSMDFSRVIFSAARAKHLLQN